MRLCLFLELGYYCSECDPHQVQVATYSSCLLFVTCLLLVPAHVSGWRYELVTAPGVIVLATVVHPMGGPWAQSASARVDVQRDLDKPLNFALCVWLRLWGRAEPPRPITVTLCIAGASLFLILPGFPLVGGAGNAGFA